MLKSVRPEVTDVNQGLASIYRDKETYKDMNTYNL